MPQDFLKKSWSLLVKRQTNILSAAFIIMATLLLSQVFGLIKQRLLASIFGVSNIYGIYDFSTLLPEALFQLTIASALASAFIPVFSEYISRGKEKDGHQMASTLLFVSVIIFAAISVVLAIFAPFFLQVFNLGHEFSPTQMDLMANLMRIFMIGQLLFLVGTFFSAFLQSYNHFFFPGIAAAFYNVGIIIGVLVLHSTIGIYSAPVGVVLGAFLFIVIQLPMVKSLGFSFKPTLEYVRSDGIKKIYSLMGPRILSIVVFQLGTLAIASFISLLPDPGRMNIIYNFAKTLAFAPIALVGQTIAQAAFPVLSREKDKKDEFRSTFLTSFNQMLYLILPITVLMLVLRNPIVRLVFGADAVDWNATVLIGWTLGYFVIAIIAQSLVALLLRGFYAFHDTRTPLWIGVGTTIFMLFIISLFVLEYHWGVESIAAAYSLASLLQVVILFVFLNRKVGGFYSWDFLLSISKLLVTTLAMGVAIYIPIRLLDELVFDTTRTINLIALTGIASLSGLTIYLILTWLFNVKEATTFLLLFKKLGNWKEILRDKKEVTEIPRTTP